MDTFLLYIFKSAIFFIAFYVCIKALLSNETFFRFNRWVVLVGSAACLLLPLVKISIHTDNPVIQAPIMMLERTLTEAIPVSQPTQVAEIYRMDMGTITLATQNDGTEPVKIGMIILCAYGLGLLVNLIILLKSVYQMSSVIRRGKKQPYLDYILVLIPEDVVPFSWGKYIVLSESDYQNNPEEIIAHEIAHAKHRHSVDLIFLESILLFQWFNPAVWLIKRELKDIHEYQADISVLKSGIDATKYQLLLVKKAVGASSYTLANSFNHSKIKKRITMMLKVRSNKWARLKLLLLLPLGTLTMVAFARPEVNEPLNSVVEYESTNILSETKIPIKEVVNLNFPVVVKYDTGFDTVPQDIKPKDVKGSTGNTKKKGNSESTYKIERDEFDVSAYKVGDRFKDNKGDEWEVVSKDPVKTKRITKNGVSTDKKATPPPPPPIKKKDTKVEVVEIVEDVEGKKAADKKSTAPPPPPIKKDVKKSDKETEEIVVVSEKRIYRSNDKKTTPPPPMNKTNVKKDEKVEIVEDVEGKKATYKKSTPPPPPPIKDRKDEPRKKTD